MTMIFAGKILLVLSAYLAVRKGFEDRAHSMPIAALCAGISWVFIFSFVHPQPGALNMALNLPVSLVWIALYLLLLYQFLLFGRPVICVQFPSLMFLPVLGGIFFGFFTLVFVLASETGPAGPVYIFSGLNLFSSILYLYMLLQRGNSRGQSAHISLFRLSGAFIINLAHIRLFPESGLLEYCLVATLFFDIIYLIMVIRRSFAEGEAVFRLRQAKMVRTECRLSTPVHRDAYAQA